MDFSFLLSFEKDLLITFDEECLCMTWHSQPFLDEEAEAYGEDESEAASCEGMY